MNPTSTGIESTLVAVLDNLHLLAVCLDRRGRVTYANPYLLDLVRAGEQIAGCDWYADFVPADVRHSLQDSYLAETASGSVTSHERSEIVTREGDRRQISWSRTPLRDADGVVSGVCAIGIDLTDQVRTEERLRHGVMYDAVTGLPSRGLFLDRVAGCIARSKRRPDYRFAALFLDVDRFKVINDSLGHQAGDEVLIEVSQRINRCLRPGDSLARLGGDEFAVLIDDIPDTQVPGLVAARIQAALTAPFAVAGRELYVTASLGTALNKPRYEGPEDLMRDADTAMHYAKARGKARHEAFDTGMHTRALVLLQLENDLHRAIERQELAVHYQPIVEIGSRRTAGFEALARWQRGGPRGGFIPPTDFIRIAEETGLILEIGEWVLHEACRQLAVWQKRLGPERKLGMSVNLSARQFAQPDLVDRVSRAVGDSGVAPGSLKLEITESILMLDPDSAARMLAELRAKDVLVSIDDFGTGYSSLSYLLRLPAQTLKIDRAFVCDLSTSSQHGEMVRLIVGLARSLGMDVIAEGVETPDQMRRLEAAGCDYLQGFLLSRAVAPVAAEKLLESTFLAP